MNTAEIVEYLDKEATEVFARKEVRTAGGGKNKICYVVTNGPHLLAVGRGSPDRLKALMPGTCQKHTKSLIVALSHVVHGPNIKYYLFNNLSESEAKTKEDDLHKRIGKINIDERKQGNKAIAESLWEQLKAKKKEALDAKEEGIREKIEAIVQVAIHDGDAFPILFKIDEYRDKFVELFDNYYTG